jgi:hypothetical protein
MSLHHIGAAKIVALVSAAIGAVILALDPTVKVALIVSIAPTVASVWAVVLGIMNRDQLKVIKVDVNTNFQKLLREKEDQNKEMAQKTTDLAHAQGRREGIESRETK